MSVGLEVIVIGFGLMLGLLAIGLHIGTALFATAALGGFWFYGDLMFRPFGTLMWSTLNNFLLVSIPLYVLMGEILVRGGITARMYAAIDDWLRPLPGGFLAGVVPGVLLALLFMGLVIIASVLDPSVSEKSAPDEMSARLRRLRDLLPPLVVFAGVMGSIYTGWATPTEAAGLGVVAATILVASYRQLTVRLLIDSLLSTVKVTAMTLLILIAAFYLNFIVGVLGIPEQVTTAMSQITVPGWQMVIILVLLYVALGCFMDSLAMMIATTPIILPVVVAIGYDPLWFGIFLVIMCEIALITPPVGMNLFVVQAVRGRGSVTDVIKGVLPFIACFIVLVALMTAFPDIVTWLPTTLL
ncbi:TRAP transporter large permease subunit [Devosia sp. 1635]|uniref:TRAP transporter large permease n=1 Tax=Devosia sp. 1635 TaxID=2726066 RepID=UPI001563D80A|nr:TRAP transporter large permease subunit [Devosia sp. 1635]